MLVCNVSLQPPRTALTAGIAAGIGAAVGVSGIKIGIGTAAGIGAASGVGAVAAAGTATGAATGTGAASGVGANVYATVGTAAGIGAAAAVGASVVTPATLNGTATNVTLSNGNLTATHSNTTDNSGARSASTKTTGKYYYEITVVKTTGAFDCAGALVSTGTYTNLVTDGTNAVSYYRNSGNMYTNNALYGAVAAYTTGDIICFAVDLDNRKVWARKGSGTWNGSTGGGTANPATNTGGATLTAAVAYAPAVGFGGGGTAATDAFTANFGATAFTYTAPSGFGNWPA